MVSSPWPEQMHRGPALHRRRWTSEQAEVRPAWGMLTWSGRHRREPAVFYLCPVDRTVARLYRHKKVLRSFYAFSAMTLLVWHREKYPACKNWVMRCWCGYLSAARCRLFAYGPADATVSKNPIISCSIAQVPFLRAFQCVVAKVKSNWAAFLIRFVDNRKCSTGQMHFLSPNQVNEYILNGTSSYTFAKIDFLDLIIRPNITTVQLLYP